MSGIVRHTGQGGTFLTRASKHVRTVAVLVALAMAAAGLGVILTDRPGPPVGSGNLAQLDFRCTPGARMGSIEYVFSVEIDNGSYSVDSRTYIKSGPTGHGSCLLAMPVPADAADVSFTPEFHRERNVGTISPGDDAVVAVVRAGVKTEPGPPMEASYTAGGIRRLGWGKVEYSLDPSSPTVESDVWPTELNGVASPLMMQQAPVTLLVQCPDDEEIAESYPSGGDIYSPGAVEWAALRPEDGQASATCESAGTRFWVEHSTDLVVLGLGAVLGLLVAIDPRRREEESKDEPGGAKAAPQVLDTVRPPVPGRPQGLGWLLLGWGALGWLYLALRAAARRRSATR